MSTLSFFRPALDALNDGKVIRSAIIFSLRILAVLVVFGGVYLLIDILKASFDMRTEGTIGGIIFSVILLSSTITIAQIFIHRSSTIQHMDETPFSFFPVCSVLVRAFGEAYASLCLAVGMGGCVFMWLAKDNPLYFLGDLVKFLPTVTPEHTFLGGIFFMAYFVLFSFISFVEIGRAHV